MTNTKDDIHIVLVDDDDLLVRFLEHKFQHWGIKLSTFDDGAEGMEAVMVLLPNLVLLDGQMPSMDGMEVLQRLKQNDATKSIPVIMLSARSSEKDIVGAFDLGADDYLVKPFQPEVLWARIQKILELR